MQAARNRKNDEFFTRLADIEAELRFYQDHFRNQVVYCNCDDPAHSQFWQYFKLHFDALGLKGLIATHYDERTAVHASMWEKSGYRTRPLANGDFRSAECAEILRSAGIVVTNPPFSLWREFMAGLMAYGKKFLIIGPLNAVTYKEVFPLLRENRLWLGNTQVKSFQTPDGGVQRFGNVYWFTNLDHPKRHEPLRSTCSYDPRQYPRYANYDGIEVSRTADIPCDYTGAMGVPISFLTKYCPEQFEILGLSSTVAACIPKDLPKRLKGGIRFYLKDAGGCYRRLYDRLVIRRREVSRGGGTV